MSRRPSRPEISCVQKALLADLEDTGPRDRCLPRGPTTMDTTATLPAVFRWLPGWIEPVEAARLLEVLLVEIPWEDHERWYAASLASESRHLRIVESDGTPAGLVRLDRTEDDEAVEIGVNLAPARRGRGLAVPVLLAALAEARTLGFTRVVARIRPDNLRSIRAFERAGFAFAREERVNGSEARRYEAIAG